MNLDRRCAPPIYARLLVELLEGWGVSPQELLKGTGLSLELLQDPSYFLTPREEVSILERVETLSPVPEWALRRGMANTTQTHGVYGYAMLTSADLRQVLQLTVRFFRLSGSFAAYELHEHDNGDYEIRVVEGGHRPSIHRFVVEELLATIITGVQEITRQTLSPKSISLDYPAPEYSDVYKEIFACPIHFNDSFSCMVFNEKDLDLRVPTWDPLTREACELQCEQVLERLRDAEGAIDAVRRVMLRLPCDRRNAEQVAELMHMSTRNLRRKLEQEGSSFQAVLDDVRCGLAIEYLSQTNLRLEDVAPLLGFSETSNMRRAFKKWTGQTPTEYRESLENPSSN